MYLHNISVYIIITLCIKVFDEYFFIKRKRSFESVEYYHCCVDATRITVRSAIRSKFCAYEGREKRYERNFPLKQSRVRDGFWQRCSVYRVECKVIHHDLEINVAGI